MEHSVNNFDYSKPIQREMILQLLTSALNQREFRFVRQASLMWLAAYPGDFKINYLLARALLLESKTSQSLPILKKINATDPEYLPALQALTDHPNADAALLSTARTDAYILDDNLPTNNSYPGWVNATREARKLLSAGDHAQAEVILQSALIQNIASALPAIVHLGIFHRKQDFAALQTLAELYSQRYPECVTVLLYLAEACMQNGEDARAVSLLHQCVSLDAAAEVPVRIWGTTFPYRPLWPSTLEMTFDLPIPAAVATSMGWNAIGAAAPAAAAGAAPSVASASAGETSSAATPVDASDPYLNMETPGAETGVHSRKESQAKLTPGDLETVRETFDKLAKSMKKPAISRYDGRFPMYVIVTSHEGLQKQYGPQTAKVIEGLLNELSLAIARRPGWGSLVLIVDQPASMAAYGLSAVSHEDANQVKLEIAGLDSALVKKGQMIGALLVAGSEQVIPFHHLPNPTEDSDTFVSSDNPYASIDENFFVPDWPVGRLSGGRGSDSSLLVRQIRALISRYTGDLIKAQWWNHLPLISSLFGYFLSNESLNGYKTSFGYTAQVWKNSSTSVFKPIGPERAMLVSPPVVTGTVWQSGLLPAKMAYYNLHGLDDSMEWYGQKSATGPNSLPDYPVALSERDFSNNRKPPRVIFSEACYGASIENKNDHESLALKFLSLGTHALVGSTCIAYGSVANPLTAADLLGNAFWTNVKGGQPVGFALMNAKISLAKLMHSRQGYLDGEDQKTLLSFILLGDPLAGTVEKPILPKHMIRLEEMEAMKTITDHDAVPTEMEGVPAEMVQQVKRVVAKYLPGLSDAEMVVHQGEWEGKSSSKTVQSPRGDPRYVVTLSKQVKVAKTMHQHYARFTFDTRGKIVKASASR
jgi:tetratricopeptide (TPR) repeat protein